MDVASAEDWHCCHQPLTLLSSRECLQNKATANTPLLKWAQSRTCPCPRLTFDLTSDSVVRRLQPYDIILQQMLWKRNTVPLCLLCGRTLP
ncbi:hypothetical protein QQF64_032812 [Cirrhinus molitorella]|uniref:Uncharacterized protein n=1 Tax=Cirrhinus molitorella TaxID=172907 RepID=A0ABR3MS42_9TELE